MIFKVDINYKIDGLGGYEETTLGGLEENDCFYVGNNNNKFKVIIKKVLSDRVLFEFDKHCKLMLPNSSKQIEVKIGETFSPYLAIDPSPSFKIKLVDIREEQRLFFS